MSLYYLLLRVDVSIIVQIIEISHRSFFIIIYNFINVLIYCIPILSLYFLVIISFSGRPANFVGVLSPSPLLPIAMKLRL
nr:MAG TPA: hypothetical protein [Microviridae sp.]